MHNICPHHPGFGWGCTSSVVASYKVKKQYKDIQYYQNLPCPLCEIDALKLEIAILKSKNKRSKGE